MHIVSPGMNIIHTSFYHPRGGKRQYYLCVGDPYYSGHIKQVKAQKLGGLDNCSLRYFNGDGALIKTNSQRYVDKLNTTKLDTIGEKEEIRIITLDNKQIDKTASKAATPLPLSPPFKTKNEIDIQSALALDLTILPRPSRHKPDKNITIVKSKHPTQSV